MLKESEFEDKIRRKLLKQEPTKPKEYQYNNTTTLTNFWDFQEKVGIGEVWPITKWMDPYTFRPSIVFEAQIGGVFKVTIEQLNEWVLGGQVSKQWLNDTITWLNSGDLDEGV